MSTQQQQPKPKPTANGQGLEAIDSGVDPAQGSQRRIREASSWPINCFSTVDPPTAVITAGRRVTTGRPSTRLLMGASAAFPIHRPLP